MTVKKNSVKIQIRDEKEVKKKATRRLHRVIYHSHTLSVIATKFDVQQELQRRRQQ